jgi:hypothetical protein
MNIAYAQTFVQSGMLFDYSFGGYKGENESIGVTFREE